MSVQEYPRDITASAIDEALGYTPANAENTRTQQYALDDLNVNSANTDTGQFTGLPARYIVRKLTLYDASISLTTATIALRTASGGGGNALVNNYAASALTASIKFADATLASVATTDAQTAGTLYFRNVTAQGAAATVSAILEIEVLP